MDGKEVFSFAINKVPKLINEIIRRSKIKNINYYILHQANKMMLNKILDMSKVKENKRLFSIKNFGNTSSASIPVTISKNLNNKKDKKNELVSRICAGFYAACITDFTKQNFKNYKEVMNTEILKNINNILIKNFNFKKKINLNTDLSKIKNWDSLKHLDFIMQFEKSFKIKFNLEENYKIKIIKDFVAKIKLKQKNNEKKINLFFLVQET